MDHLAKMKDTIENHKIQERVKSQEEITFIKHQMQGTVISAFTPCKLSMTIASFPFLIDEKTRTNKNVKKFVTVHTAGK